MSESGDWKGDHDIFADPDEQKYLYSVLDSFRQYRRLAHLNTTHTRRQNFYALPTKQWTLLSKPPFNMLSTFSLVDDAIDTNANLADAILQAGLESLGLPIPTSTTSTKVISPPWFGTATKTDVGKARSTLHQLYRDWSAEGQAERTAAFAPVMRALSKAFPIDIVTREPQGVKILIPGAGLGRLVFDLFVAGYHVEGNEISYHQLLASSFILNHTTRKDEFNIHPFASSFSNHLSRADQLRSVAIPDIWPRGAIAKGSMNMTTGDFSVVYRRQEYEQAFDAVVTVFFIDTAKSLVRYIETVKHCLRSGGVWINLGPLLWHFSDVGNNSNNHGDKSAANTSAKGISGDGEDGGDLGTTEPGAFELSEDEVVLLVQEYGFVIEKHEADGPATGYVQNTRSMLRSEYRPSHWVARKL